MVDEKIYNSLSPQLIWHEGNFAWKLSSPDYAFGAWEKKCLRALWEFNEHKGRMQFLSDIRQSLGYNITKEDKYNWENEKRDLANSGFYFGLATYYEKNSQGENEPVGVEMLTHEAPNFRDRKEEVYFFNLFPFRLITMVLSKPEQVDAFLKFQLDESFMDEKVEFRLFLLKVIARASYMSASVIRILQHYVDTALSLGGAAIELKEIQEGNDELLEKFSALLETHNLKLVRFLTRNYTNAKPRFIVAMVKALHELKLLVPGVINNKVELHKTLSELFGEIGVLNAFYEAYNKDDQHSAKHIVDAHAAIVKYIN